MRNQSPNQNQVIGETRPQTITEMRPQIINEMRPQVVSEMRSENRPRNKVVSDQEEEERIKTQRFSMITFTAGIIVLIVFLILVMEQYICLYPDSFKPGQIKTFAHKLEFTLR